jgi:phosphatidate cytidylyltransferase
VIQRIVAAAVGLAVLLPAMIWGGELAVEIIVPIVMVICLDEYARMAFPTDVVPSFVWLVLASGVLYAGALYAAPERLAVIAASVLVGTMLFVTLRPGPALDRAADALGRFAIGASWVALLGFFVLLRRLDDGLAWIFLVLVISWMSDTGGYFAGRFLGRHKLYERISPKKTWEGYAGGITFAVVGVFIVRAVGLPALSALDCVVLGALVGSLGVLGDLSQSLLKRSYGVKDAGWIMPGHGGLLDRIDSVLFVAPAVFAYATVVKGYVWTS